MRSAGTTMEAMPRESETVRVPQMFHHEGPVLVPPGADLELPIFVFGLAGPLRDVTVSLHVRHHAMGKLSLGLVSPGPRGVLLSALSGGAASSFGKSCGEPLVFTDHAPVSIADAAPPHVGPYRAVGTLAAFRGLPPQVANGCWRLIVSDVDHSGTGALIACVTLTFRV
jgi:hypothetical protein